MNVLLKIAVVTTAVKIKIIMQTILIIVRLLRMPIKIVVTTENQIANSLVRQITNSVECDFVMFSCKI